MKCKISRKGYKKDSPDVNNRFNIIPSGSITMEDVEFPIMGIDNFGNMQVMQPGGQYQFPGADYVTEFPIRKHGGIHINESNKGKFTSSAHSAGMDVQEFANHVLGNRDDYTPLQVKRANFAHVFGGRNYQQGGSPIYLTNPNDPRLRAYNDSMTVFQHSVTPNAVDLNKSNAAYGNLHRLNGEVPLPVMTTSSGQQLYKKPVQPYLLQPQAHPLTAKKKLNIKATPTQISSEVPIQIPMGNPPVDTSTRRWETAPAYKMLNHYDSSGNIINTEYFTHEGQPIQVQNKKYGGAKFNSNVDLFVKNYVKRKMGGDSLQGNSTDDVLAKRNGTFVNFLAGNTMLALLQEEAGKMKSNPNGYMQEGGQPDFLQQAQQEAMSSGKPYANNVFNQGTYPDYSVYTDTVDTGADVQVPLSPEDQVANDYQSWMNRRAAIDQNPWYGPEPNAQNQAINSPQDVQLDQPNWMQRNGQDLALGITTGINMFAALKNQDSSRKDQAKQDAKTNADSIFLPTSYGAASRGDYETNSGAFRPNQYTPVQFPGYAYPGYKMGGSHLVYQRGGEYYMSDDEIADLKAKGYEIDYID